MTELIAAYILSIPILLISTYVSLSIVFNVKDITLSAIIAFVACTLAIVPFLGWFLPYIFIVFFLLLYKRFKFWPSCFAMLIMMFFSWILYFPIALFKGSV